MIDVKSDRKMLRKRKRLNQKRQMGSGFQLKAHETQRGSVGSSIKEMQLYSLDQCDVAIGPFK